MSTKTRHLALKRPSNFTLHDLDPTDLRIVHQLQENGRATNIEVAKAVGVTEATVRRRIDRLTCNGIFRVAAVLNPRMTGYQTDAIIGISVEPGTLQQVGGVLASMPEAIYVAYTSGPYDILLEVLLKSDEALFNFLAEELPKVPGIRGTTTFHILRTVKIDYDWKLPPEFLTSANGRDNFLERRSARRRKSSARQRRVPRIRSSAGR